MYYSIVDKDFLKGFVEKKPKNGVGIDKDLDSNELIDWKNIKKHITQNSKVIVLAQGQNSQKDLEENPLYFQLLNSYQTNATSNMRFVSSITDDIKNQLCNSFSPIFFLDNSQIGFGLGENGLVLYQSKNILDKWLDKNIAPNEHTLGFSKEISKTNITNTKDFKNFQHRSSVMVITDNYIFSNIENIERTLIPIIKNTISDSSSAKFDLIIITSIESLYFVYPKERKIRVEENVLYAIVNNELKRNFSNINLQVCFKEKNSDYHDRNIITNYFRFKLTNSLSIFDEKGVVNARNSLTFDSYPHLKNNGNQTYGINTLEILKKIYLVLKKTENLKFNYSESFLFNIK